jgi:hypothetical protein
MMTYEREGESLLLQGIRIFLAVSQRLYSSCISNNGIPYLVPVQVPRKEPFNPRMALYIIQ